MTEAAARSPAVLSAMRRFYDMRARVVAGEKVDVQAHIDPILFAVMCEIEEEHEAEIADFCAWRKRARELLGDSRAVLAAMRGPQVLIADINECLGVATPAPDPWPCYCWAQFVGNGTGRGCPRCAPTNPENQTKEQP